MAGVDDVYALTVSLYIHLKYDFAELMHKLVEKRPIELPKNKEARRYLIEQLLSRGYTRKEIAKRLSISRKTVYNIITAPLPISGLAGNG